MPVTVDGIDLQFVSVTTASHWLFGTTNYTPTSSSDTFLLAKANVLSSGTAYATLKNWNVTLNSSIDWSFNQSHGDLSAIDSITWIFVVSKSESSFTINLPDGVDVDLSTHY
jgi:hypothetical protein